MSGVNLPVDEDNGGVRFTVKELLLELRRDVSQIDAKLDLKADRERVHQLAADIAAIRLERAAETSVRIDLISDFRTAQGDIGSLKDWRNRLAGGLVVVAALAGTVAARLLGFF